MLINQELLDDLLAKTADSPRLRVNLDLRNSSEDTSQRMLNALQSGSLVDIHRHSNTSETVAILRGRSRRSSMMRRGWSAAVMSCRLPLGIWFYRFLPGSGIC